MEKTYSRSRMAKLWRNVTIGAALAVTGMVGCGKGEGTTGPVIVPPPATPTGAYTLNSVDAKALPYTMYSDTGYTLQVSSGTLTITAAGKWVSKITTRETVAGNLSTYADSTFGTWTIGAGTANATFLNAETGLTSAVSWTAVDITVNDVDGSVTHKVLYKKN